MAAMSVPSVAPPRGALGALGEITPTREEFRELARDRRVIPVTRRLLADAITPVGLYATLAGDRPGTFLLESAENGHSWSQVVVRRGIGTRGADRTRRHRALAR